MTRRRKVKTARLAVEYTLKGGRTIVVKPEAVRALEETSGVRSSTKIHLEDEAFIVSAHIETVKDDLGIAVTNDSDEEGGEEGWTPDEPLPFG